MVESEDFVGHFSGFLWWYLFVWHGLIEWRDRETFTTELTGDVLHRLGDLVLYSREHFCDKN